jgi:nitrogen fixation protein NifX
VANNIFPMKVKEPESIADLLDKLQDVLKAPAPPPWLRKAMAKGQEKELEFDDD